MNTYSRISTVPRGSEQIEWASPWTVQASRSGVVRSEWAEWAIRAKGHSERPSSPFKTRPHSSLMSLAFLFFPRENFFSYFFFSQRPGFLWVTCIRFPGSSTFPLASWKLFSTVFFSILFSSFWIELLLLLLSNVVTWHSHCLIHYGIFKQGKNMFFPSWTFFFSALRNENALRWSQILEPSRPFNFIWTYKRITIKTGYNWQRKAWQSLGGIWSNLHINRIFWLILAEFVHQNIKNIVTKL